MKFREPDLRGPSLEELKRRNRPEPPATEAECASSAEGSGRHMQESVHAPASVLGH